MHSKTSYLRIKNFIPPSLFYHFFYLFRVEYANLLREVLITSWKISKSQKKKKYKKNLIHFQTQLINIATRSEKSYQSIKEKTFCMKKKMTFQLFV